jgi:hypothetical protein
MYIVSYVNHTEQTEQNYLVKTECGVGEIIEYIQCQHKGKEYFEILIKPIKIKFWEETLC